MSYLCVIGRKHRDICSYNLQNPARLIPDDLAQVLYSYLECFAGGWARAILRLCGLPLPVRAGSQ